MKTKTRLLSVLLVLVLVGSLLPLGALPALADEEERYDVTVTGGTAYDWDEETQITTAAKDKFFLIHCEGVSESRYVSGITVEPSVVQINHADGNWYGVTMPETAITIEVQYADRETYTVDMTQGAVEVPRQAIDNYPYDPAEHPWTDLPCELDLDGDGQNDISYDAGTDEGTYIVTPLEGTNLASRTVSSHYGNNTRYSQVTFLFPAQADSHTVTFQPLHGSDPLTRTVPDGQTVAEPTPPPRYSDVYPRPYSFAGWFTDEAHQEEFDFTTPITEDLTLYAGWRGYLWIDAYTQTGEDSFTGGGGMTQYNSDTPDSHINPTVWRGDTVTLTAVPDPGYEFVGWGKDLTGNPNEMQFQIVGTDNPWTFPLGDSFDSFRIWNQPTFKGVISISPIFREIPPTLTLHWSSIDGVDLMEPIVIDNLASGSTIDDAVKQYQPGATLFTELFQKDGYTATDYRTTEPLTAFAGEAAPMDALRDASVLPSEPVVGNMDLYYIMFKQIDKVEAAVTAPACGTETSIDKDQAWKQQARSQTNKPVITPPEGALYTFTYTEDGTTYDDANWVVNEYRDLYAGAFRGGESYLVSTAAYADFGYCFSDPTVTVTGGVLSGDPLPERDLCSLFLSVPVEHDPADPVTENVKAPGCETDGSHEEAVYCNGCQEELSREKVTDPKLGHDWGDWVVTREAAADKDGVMTRTCRRDPSHTETKPIPATGSEDEPAATFTLTYDLNGGTLNGKTGKVTVEAKEGSTVTLPKPTREGYTFDYWKGSRYEAGDSYTVAGDHTFTAQWKASAAKPSASPKPSATPKPTATPKPAAERGPKTGDDSPIALWALVLGASALGLGVTLGRRKRAARK